MAKGVREIFSDNQAEYFKQLADEARQETEERTKALEIERVKKDARKKVPIIAASIVTAGAFDKGILIAPFVSLEQIHPIQHPLSSMRNAAYNRRALKPFGDHHVVVPNVKVRNQDRFDESGEKCWGKARTIALGDHTQALRMTDAQPGKSNLYLMREGLRIGNSIERDNQTQDILNVSFFRPGGVSASIEAWQFGVNGRYNYHREEEDPSIPIIVEFTDVSVENFHNPIMLHDLLSRLATSCAVEINPGVLSI